MKLHQIAYKCTNVEPRVIALLVIIGDLVILFVNRECTYSVLNGRNKRERHNFVSDSVKKEFLKRLREVIQMKISAAPSNNR